MDQIVNVQQALMKKISSSYDTFIAKEESLRTIANAEIRLERLRDNWKVVVENDTKIRKIPEVDTQHVYFSHDFMGSAIETYDDVKSEYKEFIRLKSTPVSIEPKPAVISQAVDLGSLIQSLPQISLPTFSGKPSEWPNFRDMFKTLIHNRENTPLVVKLTFLRSYLKDEALDVIKNIAITEANYETAWQTLNIYYENERRLVNTHLSDLFSVKIMKSESHQEIKRLLSETFIPLEALEALKRPTKQWSDLIVFMLVSKLDQNTRRDWERRLGNSAQAPTLDSLKNFLQSQALMLESLEKATHPVNAKSSQQSSKQSSPSKSNTPAAVHTVETKSKNDSSKPNGKCPLCKKDHYLRLCEIFKSKPIPERRVIVAENRLCFSCLGTHLLKDCKSQGKCFYCQSRKHNSLLHLQLTHETRPTSNRQQSSGQDVPNASNIQSQGSKNQDYQNSNLANQDKLNSNLDASSSNHFSGISDKHTNNSMGVFLSSALIQVKTNQGKKVVVRALIDQCSQSSFISESLVQRLKLKTRQTYKPISSVGNGKLTTCTRETDFQISPHFKSDFSYQVNALIIANVSAYVPPKTTVNSNLAHLLKLQLADPEFTLDLPVEVLLGADVHADLVLEGLSKGLPHEPIATASRLGWYISGRAPLQPQNQTASVIVHHCLTDDHLSDLVQNFWRQEEVPKIKTLTPEEEQCENFFLETTTRDACGRYIVRLPFKDNQHSTQDLGNSFDKAVRMLRSMERKFASNPEFEKLYKEFMLDYLQKGHMKPIGCESPEFKELDKSYFLPHHGVLKPTSTSTKLRTVFNGSSKTSRGLSLNDLLHTGPNLLPELTHLICNWRNYEFVFVADIQQMFRQIRVDDRDIHFQAIVWRFSPSDPIQVYYLTTVTYGLVCSPWQATRTIRQLAADNDHLYPLGSQVVQKECYMDDMLSGSHSLQDALAKQAQLINLLKVGGLNLRKWLSNHPDLLNLPVDQLAVEPEILFNESAAFAVLGLHWQAKSDAFRFEINCSPVELYTKRSILSKIAKIFDPMGWIAPVVITAKIFMQSLWLLKCNWDDELPSDFVTRWKDWFSRLSTLKTLKIPRYTHWSPEVQICELHGFADASQQAFASVLYLRIVSDNQVFTSLQLSKTRVAPLNTQSIPRLELCAAQLLAQLTSHFVEHTSIRIDSVHLWSDSKDVLFWLRSYPARWQTYVSNRCSDILTLVPNAHWHYVKSRDNPADLSSRGIDPSTLETCDLWWNGPTWLKDSSEPWPTTLDVLLNPRPLEERKTSDCISSMVCNTPPESVMWTLVHRFSKLGKLLRVTAYITRFLRALVRKVNENVNTVNISLKFISYDFLGPVDHEGSVIVEPVELQNSTLFWAYFHQRIFFAKEIKILNSDKEPRFKGYFKKLNPYCEKNLLRVGGRLSQASLSYDQKHPIILPGDCFFSTLLIRDIHQKTLHGGIQLTLGTLRHQFWLINGRPAVKRVINNCKPCIRFSAQKYTQLLGNLPYKRMTPRTPSIDLASITRVRYTFG